MKIICESVPYSCDNPVRVEISIILLFNKNNVISKEYVRFILRSLESTVIVPKSIFHIVFDPHQIFFDEIRRCRVTWTKRNWSQKEFKNLIPTIFNFMYTLRNDFSSNGLFNTHFVNLPQIPVVWIISNFNFNFSDRTVRFCSTLSPNTSNQSKK